MRLTLLFLLIPIVFHLGLPAQVVQIAPGHSFTDAVWGSQFGWREDVSTYDAGGILTFFVENLDSTASDRIIDIRFEANGQEHEPVGWRAWPSVITPAGSSGSLSTVHVKGMQFPFRADDHVQVIVETASGQIVSAELELRTSDVKFGNVVPSPGNDVLNLYLRNDGAESLEIAGLRLNERYFTANMDPELSVVGNDWSILPGSILILKVAPEAPLGQGDPLAIQINAVRQDGTEEWICGGVRLVAAEFPLGTWHSSAFNPTEENLRGRQALRGISINTVMGPGIPQYMETAWEEYDMKAMWNPGVNADIPGSGVPAVQQFNNSPFLSCWFLDDEPDLGPETVEEIFTKNQVFWENGPDKPTYLVLASQKKYSRYGWFVDIIAMDHYAAPGPPNVIPLTWIPIVGRKGALKESLEYTEYLKFNTEPRRMWTWAQLAAGWNQQPTDAAIDYQFWAHIIGGAKGIQWFVAQSRTPQEYPDAWAMADQLAASLNSIKNLCLYGEFSAEVDVDTPKVSSRALIGEEAMVVGVLNDNYAHQWLGSFTPIEYSTIPMETPYSVEFDLPHWLPAEQIYRVTENGKEPVDYWMDLGNGRLRITPPDPIYDRSHIYVIGKLDSEPPTIPANLKIPHNGGPSDYILTWREARDNFGVRGYTVHYNDYLVDTVFHPVYRVDTALYDCGTGTWRVTAFDASGNTSPSATLETNPMQTGTYYAEVISYPEVVAALPGETASIAVTMEAAGPVRYRWEMRSGGMDWTAIAASGDFSGLNGPVLQINSVSQDLDGAEFRCIATGICTPPDSTGAIAIQIGTDTGIPGGFYDRFSLYPVPAERDLVIRIKEGGTAAGPGMELDYGILDVSGRLVAHGNVKRHDNGRWKVRVDAIPNGTYFLLLLSGDVRSALPFVVLH